MMEEKETESEEVLEALLGQLGLDDGHSPASHPTEAMGRYWAQLLESGADPLPKGEDWDAFLRS